MQAALKKQNILFVNSGKRSENIFLNPFFYLRIEIIFIFVLSMNKMPPITHYSALSRVFGMKKSLLLFPVVFLFLTGNMVLSPPSFSQTSPVPYTMEDRDRSIRMEEQIKSLREEMKSMREEIRSKPSREETNARFESMQTFLYWGFGIMFGSLFAIVGFVLWDRRTFLKPFQLQMQDMDASLIKEKSNVRNLIAVLKELAKEDAKVAQALKQFNLF